MSVALKSPIYRRHATSEEMPCPKAALLLSPLRQNVYLSTLFNHHTKSFGAFRALRSHNLEAELFL